MKKVYKVMYVLILTIISFSIIYQVSASDIWSDAQAFINTGASSTGMTQEDTKLMEKIGIDTKAKFKELIDFLWGLGLLVIFISTVVLGIKYMLVLPNEKSRIKQATTPYVIGVVIIFGALTIWKFIIFLLDGSL